MLRTERLLASKDRKLLFKNNTFLIILSIFVLMSLASSYIGWSSQHTINKVYDATANELVSVGKPVPPSPFESVPTLSITKNMIIYVVLIGALLAIILGHIVAINDRNAGVTRILFSKSFSKRSFLISKLISSIQILVIALSSSLIISCLSLAVLNNLSIHTLSQLLMFYSGSFVYLSGFVFLGIFFGLKTKNSAQAILIPLLIWILITFAIPELGSALYPTSSLNPILPQTNVLDSSTLAFIHSVVYPFSISEQYKEFGSNALGLNSNKLSTNVVPYSQSLHLLLLFLWMLLTFGLIVYAVRNYDASEGDIYE